MHLSRALTIALASLSLTLAAAVPARPAAACGSYVRKSATQRAAEQGARDAVTAHFEALAAGDARAVRKVWAPSAKITSLDAAGQATRTERLGRALPRWLAARDGLAWTVTYADQAADGTVTVAAQVTWAGTLHDDVITLAEQDGRWRITAKSSQARVRTAAGGGY